VGHAEFALLALSSLFVIVDPLGLVPAFLAMTGEQSAADRTRTARTACIVAAGILVAFAAAGPHLLSVLGITMPAFQVAGSILLLLVALDMLRARSTETRETRVETAVAAERAADHLDVAVSPLAVPMLAGPGALSTVLLLRSRAGDGVQHALLYGAILLVLLSAYLLLRVASRHANRMKPIAMRVVTRLMGMLLAAIAVQFFLDGIRASGAFSR
jgi:multiple antibiotic resistance protein